MIFDTFTEAGKTVHLSPGAVFVRSKDDTGFHELLLCDYGLSAHTGESAPRLTINRGKKPLPYAVAAKWKIERRARSICQAIELTLLEEEFKVAFAGLPRLIDHIEAGHDDDFKDCIPVPTLAGPTKVNIWTLKAENLATVVNKAHEAQLLRRRTTHASQLDPESK